MLMLKLSRTLRFVESGFYKLIIRCTDLCINYCQFIGTGIRIILTLLTCSAPRHCFLKVRATLSSIRLLVTIITLLGVMPFRPSSACESRTFSPVLVASVSRRMYALGTPLATIRSWNISASVLFCGSLPGHFGVFKYPACNVNKSGVHLEVSS